MHTDSSNCINELKSFLVAQEYRHCRIKGEIQQIIRKDNEGIENGHIYSAIAERKVRLLKCSIETEVPFSNPYKMV